MSKKTNVNIAICLLPGLQPIVNGGAEFVDYDESEEEEKEREDILVAVTNELAEIRKVLEKQGADLAELKQSRSTES